MTRKNYIDLASNLQILNRGLKPDQRITFDRTVNIIVDVLIDDSLKFDPARFYAVVDDIK